LRPRNTKSPQRDIIISIKALIIDKKGLPIGVFSTTEVYETKRSPITQKKSI
jgi:hypothetical protein